MYSFVQKLILALLVKSPLSLQVKEDPLIYIADEEFQLLLAGYANPKEIPSEVQELIRSFASPCPLRYKGKCLPRDLSHYNLYRFDFTGCHFVNTQLGESNLNEVILKQTTCDYVDEFNQNMKENSMSTMYLTGKVWRLIASDLGMIKIHYTKIKVNYNLLKNGTNRQVFKERSKEQVKAELIRTASHLARLPLYEGLRLCLEAEYWCCYLLELRSEWALNNVSAEWLFSELDDSFHREAIDYCWSTNYKPVLTKVKVDRTRVHANFNYYLEDFKKGVREKCIARAARGVAWYEESITENIEGLKKAYPKIDNQQLRQEACSIAYGLSKSYQVGKMSLLLHYLLYQIKLIRLQNMLPKKVKPDIYYQYAIIDPLVPNDSPSNSFWC